MNVKKVVLAIAMGCLAICLPIIALASYIITSEKWILILIGLISLTLYAVFLKILIGEIEAYLDEYVHGFIDYVSKHIREVR